MSDLISRQAALEMLNDDELERQVDDVFDGSLHRYKRAAQRIIAQLPTIDPAENGGCWGCCCEKLGQVKHGKWVAAQYGDGTVRTECSVCGYGRGLPPVRNYCPNCGADMRGE